MKRHPCLYCVFIVLFTHVARRPPFVRQSEKDAFPFRPRDHSTFVVSLPKNIFYAANKYLKRALLKKNVTSEFNTIKYPYDDTPEKMLDQMYESMLVKATAMTIAEFA